MIKKIEPWFGFTEDKVFGMVMENKEDVLRQDDDLSFLICKRR